MLLIRSQVLAVLALLTIAPLLSAQTRPKVGEGGVTYWSLLPSASEPEVTKEFNDPHWIYVQQDIVLKHDAKLPADRHELLLWIPGTKPPNGKEPEPGHVIRGSSHNFCLMAASLGYHVIALSYPNHLSASSCNNEKDPEAFEDFRMAIIQGGSSPHITVSRTDSIENRLIKLLQSLSKSAPNEAWDSFLNADGGIKWERIAVAGQSQGGGHSALIGIHHPVTRVICFGAPKDYSVALDKPAAWYLKPSATAKERFFAFNHEQDRQGCTPQHQMDNLKALKLDEFGQPTSVDGAKPPYSNAHILMTNHPGTKVDSQTAHGTMISPKNEALFGEVWRYMLTK